MGRSQPTLPTGRAFVVQFHVDADLDAGGALGRVEHLTSGRIGRFETWGGLLDFVAHTLDAGNPDGERRADHPSRQEQENED